VPLQADRRLLAANAGPDQGPTQRAPLRPFRNQFPAMRSARLWVRGQVRLQRCPQPESHSENAVTGARWQGMHLSPLSNLRSPGQTTNMPLP
jgi:hypothetical protein